MSPQFLQNLLLFGLLVATRSALAADEHPGQKIYIAQCASCHGENGLGTKDNGFEPLFGDKPIVELARVITETMPEGEPEKCVGKDAEAVAAYMYDAFYSPIAQARIRPPRIELSRLTVRQYQETIADLIGSFRGAKALNKERGLKAEYFDERRFQNDKRRIDRRDSGIDFDFKDGTPASEGFKQEEFSIRWQGSVIAPETGEYEFIVQTSNGVRLWINNLQTPLIDGWVRSGNDIMHRESMFLLGGRAYPLKLDFFKFKDPAAKVRLLWKAPHGVEEVIPERCLVPDRFIETLCLATRFPPDDRSVGYVRGSSVSKEWDDATTRAAIDVASAVIADLDRLAGTRDSDDKRPQKLREFCRRFVERAFRRPLTDDQQKQYIDRQFEAVEDPALAVRRVVLLTLKSPRFLFREVGGENDAYDRAARLSFTLWDSLPDRPLAEAASRDQLNNEQQLRQQAARMVNDDRTKAKLREFLRQWLKLDQLVDFSKDSELFPGTTPEFFADLRTSLELSIEDVVSSDNPDFRDLLLSDRLHLNGRLAQLYGADLPAEAGFQPVAFEPDVRAGVLTHPFLMSGFAYHATSSPIHRGVFVARSLLGRSLKPPAEAITPIPPDLHPDLTTRERIALQTSPVACRTCHNLINPLGFPLEQFDAIGRFRQQERNRDIDPLGSYLQRTGELVEFRGARELSSFLANSSETHAAFAEQLFQHFVKQALPAYGIDQREKLRAAFVAGEFNINKLLTEIAIIAAGVQPVR